MKILSSRSGITLLETIIVLIIGGLIISGIWVTYSQMSLNDKVRRTVNAVDKTVATTREFLSTRNNIPLDLSAQIHNQNLMPSEVTFDQLVGNQANYTSPLGAQFIVTSVPGPNNRLFFVRVSFKRGADECKRFIPYFLGNFRLIRERGLASFSFGTLIKGEATTGAPQLVSGDVPTPAQVVQECANTNAVGLYFAVRS